MRTPPAIFKANAKTLVDEDEEITILYHNGKVVSIDGQSLWMVLRVCDGQRESGIGKNALQIISEHICTGLQKLHSFTWANLPNIDTSRGQTAFSYKKWDLQYQDSISDVISLG